MDSEDGDGGLDFLMILGHIIVVSGSGRYAKVHAQLAVTAKTLAPRLSDIGAVDTSIQFFGRSGGTVVTLDIPCGQNNYAAVGFAQHQLPNVIPSEWVAQCTLQ